MNHTCCFIGHRTINETPQLQAALFAAIETLIVEHKVETFLFGSKSRFNDLCLETVTRLKQTYPHIKRVWVRAEYAEVDPQYLSYVLESYDDTYFPSKIIGAGRASYVERNYEMIRKSRYCVIYYHEECAPTKRKSGTKIALDYAKSQGKTLIML